MHDETDFIWSRKSGDLEFTHRYPHLHFGLVLFLDFDGVLHPQDCPAQEMFCFMGNFVDAMRIIDPEHRMPIVISSMWRHRVSVDGLRSRFPGDIASQIVGATPYKTLAEVEAITDWTIYGGIESKKRHRQREVMQWMNEFAPDGDWIAIDDRPQYFHRNEPRLFVVPGEGLSGFTTEVATSFISRVRSSNVKQG